MADIFEITGTVSGTVFEDGVLTGTGLLKVEGQTGGFDAYQGSSSYGTFSLLADGNWTYALNNAAAGVQALAGGQSIHDRFVVSWFSGAEQARSSVDVTVQGQNDVAIVSGNTTATLAAASQSGTTGVLSVEDVDTGEKTFVARSSVAGQLGDFSIDTSGAWSYALRSGAVVPAGSTDDIFNIQTADGTASSVKVTVTSSSPSTGSDRLNGSAGNETIDGLGGIDTVTYQGTASNYTLTPISGGFQLVALSGQDGTDTLNNIERLEFSDKKLALDLGVSQAGGGTALLLGAVLGSSLMLSASKQALLGAAIGLFDQGYTLQQLSGAIMRLPIWDVLTNHASPTNTDIANYLLTTVNGHAPDSTTLNAAINALNTETGAAQGNFLESLAASAANQTQVDLVGLSHTGLVYA